MAHQSPIRTGSTSRDSAIPDKLYFRIGEVARLCAVPAYVLRFWESEFPQLKPNKGGSGQRLFRRRDVEMALRIKTLLYDEGYTIPGARQLLRAEQRQKEPELASTADATPDLRSRQLQQLHGELEDLLALVSGPLPAARTQPEAVRRQRTLRAVDKQSDNLFDFGKIEIGAEHEPNKEGT
jgi:DNA-binding transcriptional MerR regulator